MKKSLVSIILPTYNGSRYLAKSIQSCIEQTYPNWELIIVDDCSSDTTPEIISAFVALDGRIRSVRHEKNKKLPGALNTGFALAQGDFLTWTSDDNLYRPHALETMLNFLQAYPRVDLVYTDYSIINDNGVETRVQSVRDPEKLVIGCIVGASFLYRCRVYETIGEYAEDLFLAEDYDYWLRTFAKFQIAPLHENLYCYRKHESSLASTRRNEITRTGYTAKLRNLPSIFPKLDRSTRALAHVHMAGDAKKLGRPLESLGHLTRAFLYSPKVVLSR